MQTSLCCHQQHSALLVSGSQSAACSRVNSCSESPTDEKDPGKSEAPQRRFRQNPQQHSVDAEHRPCMAGVSELEDGECLDSVIIGLPCSRFWFPRFRASAVARQCGFAAETTNFSARQRCRNEWSLFHALESTRFFASSSLRPVSTMSTAQQNNNKRRKAEAEVTETDETRSDPCIGLDVGGRVFYCYHSTLTNTPGTLATRFGGDFLRRTSIH